jgi:hypothetical protein
VGISREEALEVVDSVDTEIQEYLRIEVNVYPDIVSDDEIEVLEINEYESSNQRIIRVMEVYEKLKKRTTQKSQTTQ